MTESTSEYKKRIEEIKQSIENEPYMAKMREDIAEGISKTGIRQATVEEQFQSVQDHYEATVQEKFQNIDDQFQAVVENTTGKDVISAPEIIVARGGAQTLGERLDKDSDRLDQVELYDYKQPIGKKQGEGFVSFVEDGGSEEAFLSLKSLFDTHDKKFTVSIVADWPDKSPGSMSWDQVRQLQKEGHEIASHSLTHKPVDTLTEEEQYEEIVTSKKILTEQGLNIKTYVYPNTVSTDYTNSLTAKHYRSAIGPGNCPPEGWSPPLNTHSVGRIALGTWQSYTTDEIETMVTNAKANGTWLIFLTHVHANTAPGIPPEGNLGAITQVFNHCIANGVDVVKYDEGLDRMENIMSVGHFGGDDRDYYYIGADYKTYSNKILGLNYEKDTPSEHKPSHFGKANAVIYSNIFNSSKDGYPENKTGILKTERLGAENEYRYIKQTFKPYDSVKIYTRYSLSSDAWSNWSVQNNLIFGAPNSITNLTKPSEIALGKMTITTVNSEAASSDKFPESTAGILTTVNISSTYAYQSFKLNGSGRVYERSIASSDTWGAWSRLSPRLSLLTAERNALSPTVVSEGDCVFDKDLKKPIWRNRGNTGWVDATGATV